MKISRRSLLLGGAAVGVVSFVPSAIGQVPAAFDTLPASAPTRNLTLTAREIDARLLGADGPLTRRVCAYDGELFKMFRFQRGTRLIVDFENALPDPTTVHWHGIRLPYLSDGVPPLTQDVVEPGGHFRYNVPLPDAGFYFIHPHCDETGQVGRGLAALLVVDDPAEAKAGYDAECFVVVKDWRLAPDGKWLDMTTDDGAANAGTFGTIRATNGKTTPPRVEAPAFGDVRVRALVADATRVIDLGCDSDDAFLIAVDGQALPPVSLNALPNGVWRMGSAMRADVQIRMPAPGEEVKIYDYRSDEPYLLTTLVAVDTGKRKTPVKPRPLPAPQVPLPDLKKAQKLEFLLQVSAGPTAVSPPLPADDPLSKALANSLCVGSTTHWAISRDSWSTREDLRLPPPLARMDHGASYIVSMTNVTKHVHPMHLHGHIFRVLSHSKKPKMPQYLADTVIVEPNETVEIAFKAVSGNWVFHCHILEHMDTGLMGWFKVA
ncbi:putative metallo-oxidoreductase protein [Azorhizobium caulinodans ORS 571]|uniref:Putative metallo-oxidoreductase protein n=1 Tax=Azorhizobium caulinodans (strain ATCC 43989 / DSM 5975 / JCM 20966 / LMG 6465 / NBRC 14845 / NCIMB 13405 / ORS 571) TaxID=438753 RepID=A8I954_AZOC5|nr:multicopper oxidase family protein [Azorhizobium caulinodans]BAF88743.1 putative metallo-oxidoreductase protein [Azorhizobium caulinodans ORS 571]